jgi:hypothetical protein
MRIALSSCTVQLKSCERAATQKFAQEMKEVERWDAKCARLEHSVAQLHARHTAARRQKLRQFACADACALLKLAVNALLALLFAIPTLLYLAFRALRAAFRAARRGWRRARTGACRGRQRTCHGNVQDPRTCAPIEAHELWWKMRTAK